MNRYIFTLILLLGLSLPLSAQEAVPDIRVAIDVSGSMKKNDPHNLRSPALNLLVGLMPDGMYSGIWTFGQYVNMQVKYGKVNAAWRRKARREADKIHSRALFTNIEEAIQRASYNWKKPDKRYNRNLILLTDGVVDISRDADVNQASRQRILEYWIPRLKKAGVKVHTIALSENVDQDLLTTLSASTHGWYEQIDDAGQLQKIFLRLFEKSARRDTLPIEGNRFHVDDNINDMTLLVFHKPGAKPLTIHTPNAERWSEEKAPGKVAWFNEDTYDLVTIKNPQAGDWVLETEADPDNRVMVVTNLKLKVGPMSEHLLAGEALEVHAHLEQKGKPVMRQDFLKLVQFSVLDQTQGDETPASFSLQDQGEVPDQKVADGIYSQRLDTSLGEGLHTITIRADGATFQREYRHVIQVHGQLAKLDLEKDQGFLVQLRPEPNLLDTHSLNLSLKRADGEHSQWHEEHGVWRVTLPESLKDSQITVVMKGKRNNGEPVEVEYTRKLSLEQPKVAAAQSHGKSEEHDKAEEHHGKEQTGEHADTLTAETEHDKAEEHAGDEETHAKDSKEEHTNWTLVIWLTVMVNLLLIVIGIGVWLFLKKRKRKADAEIEQELKV